MSTMIPESSLPAVSFKNTHVAFLAKSDRELNRSRWLFKLINNPSAVKFFSALTLWSMRMGLPIERIVKSTIFRQFCGGETIEESKLIVDQLKQSQIGAILDYSIEGKESDEDFEGTKQEVIRIIYYASSNPSIPYTSLKLTGVCRVDLLEKLSSRTKLSHNEQLEYRILKDRLDSICNTAYKTGVPIYFDAEESWIQDAIDDLALEMMRQYNSSKAIVLTTLQMYRRDRLAYLKLLIDAARRENFFLGIKLVRGAYWEKENERAATMNYVSPMHRTKEDTDLDFDLAGRICLENIDIVTLCAGTHNEESTLYLLRAMDSLNIKKNDRRVYFSQLFGMSDHISYNLASEGYNVTKYLPYGPVKSVIPYLIRRAQENTAIAGQMGRELQLILAEKKRRNCIRFLRSGGDK
jgi:proline dehydrogenase